ncbi:hypothetical protein PT115_09090, partial [Erysipelothrix rhusiopathiae]|nr:hypothetical protein [Erysipelothrix rhusiopathiae]
NVNTLVQYFTTTDESVITSYAKQLFKLNDYRKEQGKALKEVAFFTQQYQKYQLQTARRLIGTLDLDSRSKNVLFVEDFE